MVIQSTTCTLLINLPVLDQDPVHEYTCSLITKYTLSFYMNLMFKSIKYKKDNLFQNHKFERYFSCKIIVLQ